MTDIEKIIEPVKVEVTNLRQELAVLDAKFKMMYGLQTLTISALIITLVHLWL